MVSVQSVIDDLKDLRTNTKDRQRGYAYIQSNDDVKKNRFEIDALDVLEELKDYEVDLRETIMPVDATNPYYLDYYYNPNYSSVEYKDYCIEEYLPEGWTVGRGDNSYNWMGNITNTINFVAIKAPDGEDYLVIRFHRWGDERVNYTDDILCKMSMDDLFELESTYKYSEISVDGKEYLVNTNLFSEGMEIVGYSEENSEYDFDEEYYGYGDEDEIAAFIREKWQERAQEAVL
jgi:hypothetical protein